MVAKEDWDQICFDAAQRAKAGDAEARQWISNLLYGEGSTHARIAAVSEDMTEVEWSSLDALIVVVAEMLSASKDAVATAFLVTLGEWKKILRQPDEDIPLRLFAEWLAERGHVVWNWDKDGDNSVVTHDINEARFRVAEAELKAEKK